ncbi:hypothetical protein ACT4S5_01615 [Kocuria oceani]|uniref:hypothetical protein n=1 Tax=Kocuria oceani TaxID=988827 RepID=UPI0040375A7F
MTTTSSSPQASSMTLSPRAGAPSSQLGPEEDFPEDLDGLSMTDLQVLHSRVTRQLDHDYLTDPAGPHFVTMDRRQELLTELDARNTA